MPQPRRRRGVRGLHALAVIMIGLAAAPGYVFAQQHAPATAAKSRTAKAAPAPGAAGAPGPALPAPAAPVLMTDIFETVVKVPVTLKLVDGRMHTGEMVVTHYRPQGDGPFPVVVLHHGRSLDRTEPKRFRSVGSVRFWIRRGFAVIVPTRLGYGDSGLRPDPDFSSRECENRSYVPAMAAMLTQTEAVLAMARGLPWIDGQRVLVVGQSYGGFAAVGASGHAIQGLVGAINFAGGGGGNPIARPGNPCGADKLAETVAAAGTTARVRMLWLYAENDRYWGANLPRKWHAAYAKAGGKADLVMFPPVGDDGHRLIGDGFSLWRPYVDRYLERLGFQAPRAVTTAVPTTYAPVYAIDKVPYLTPEARVDGYAKFLGGDLPRAFAVAPNGAWGASWGASVEAAKVALERCAKHDAKGCRLYAVDDAVVWQPPSAATGVASGR